MSKSKAWGFHLILDMGGCNDRINDPEVVKEFLVKLVPALDMFPIGKPQVVFVDTDEGKGVSGIQLITTSTITFHGDADGNCVYLDVFSCKEYKPEIVLEMVVGFFAPTTIEQRMVVRNAR